MTTVDYMHIDHKVEERQGWDNIEEIKSEGEESEEEEETEPSLTKESSNKEEEVQIEEVKTSGEKYRPPPYTFDT